MQPIDPSPQRPVFEELFTDRLLAEIFPVERTGRFFEALFGDAQEGAYDIRLTFCGADAERLLFAFELRRRPGRCLACNLTYGLPEVFKRHPVIDLDGVVARIGRVLDGRFALLQWRIGPTEEISSDLHRIPLQVTLAV